MTHCARTAAGLAFVANSALKAAIVVLLAGMTGARAGVPDDENGLQLRRYTRPDGRTECYYAAGDEFLGTAWELMDEYWSRIARSQLNQLRGHLDNLLPAELKGLGHKPADAMMKRFAEAFFAARNAKTGLIPHSYGGWSPSFLVDIRGKQPVYLVSRAVELLQWFPDDPGLRDDCAALAEATMKHFDFEFKRGRKGGLWGFVDVETGEARGPVTITLWHGAVAEAFAWLSRQNGDRKYLDWADQKMEFVWRMRLNPELPILSDVFLPTVAVMNDGWTSDTDTLYYVRKLFKVRQISGQGKYGDWAMAVTDLWYDRAWNPSWGHFIRKLRPDGTPAVDTLYGDAKYNTLEILLGAYELTRDGKYLDRFQRAWQNLLRLGRDGLVADAIKQGRMSGETTDPQQTMFLAILLRAFRISGDSRFLAEAETFGQRVLAAGKKAWRMEGCQAGHAFLGLATARRKIGRAEIGLPGRGSRLRLARGGQSLLDVTVAGDTAVLYVPQGRYELTVSDDGASQSRPLVVEPVAADAPRPGARRLGEFGPKPLSAPARAVSRQIAWDRLDGCAHIRGFNYQPSWGSNGVAIWIDKFDARRFRLELALGKRYFPRFNCVRLWLSWSAYRKTPQQFLRNFDQAIDICNELGLLAIPCLFTRWFGNPPFDPVTPKQYFGADFQGMFGPYLEGVVGAHRGDENILAWDLCNEPKGDPAYLQTEAGRCEQQWLKFVHASVKRIDPAAKTCVGTIAGRGWGPYDEPLSDLLTPHIYESSLWKTEVAPTTGLSPEACFDKAIRDYKADLERRGVNKPILSTETCWGSLDDMKRRDIIRVSLSALCRHRVGFLAHALYTSPVADLHPPELGPVEAPGDMAFIRLDGTLRPGHDVFNEF